MADPISGGSRPIQSTGIDQTQKTRDSENVKAGSVAPYVQTQQQQQAQQISLSRADLGDKVTQLQELLEQAKAQGSEKEQGKEQSRPPHGFKGIMAKAAHKLHGHHGLMSLFGKHHLGGPPAMHGLEQSLTHMMSRLKAARALSGQAPAGKTPLETPAMRPAELSPEEMSIDVQKMDLAAAGNAPPASDALFRDQVLHMTPGQIKPLLDQKSNLSPEVRNYLEAFVKYADQPAVKDLQIATLKFQHDWHDGPPEEGTAEAGDYEKDGMRLRDLEAKYPPPRPEDFGVASTPPHDRNAPPTFTDTLFRDQVLRMTPDQIKPLLDQKSDLPPEARNYLDAFVKYTDQPAVKDLRLDAMKFLHDWPEGPPEEGTPEAGRYEEDRAQLQDRMSKYPPPRPEDFGVAINQPQQQKADPPPELQSWLDDPAVKNFQQAQAQMKQKWPDGPPKDDAAKKEEYDRDFANLAQRYAECPPPPRPEELGIDGQNPDPTLAGNMPIDDPKFQDYLGGSRRAEPKSGSPPRRAAGFSAAVLPRCTGADPGANRKDGGRVKEWPALRIAGPVRRPGRYRTPADDGEFSARMG